MGFSLFGKKPRRKKSKGIFSMFTKKPRRKRTSLPKLLKIIFSSSNSGIKHTRKRPSGIPNLFSGKQNKRTKPKGV